MPLSTFAHWPAFQGIFSSLILWVAEYHGESVTFGDVTRMVDVQNGRGSMVQVRRWDQMLIDDSDQADPMRHPVIDDSDLADPKRHPVIDDSGLADPMRAPFLCDFQPLVAHGGRA